MKKYEVPMLEVDQEEIFAGVPDDLFDDAMEELDAILQQQMMKNEIQESQSITFAARFVTTM